MQYSYKLQPLEKHGYLIKAGICIYLPKLMHLISIFSSLNEAIE